MKQLLVIAAVLISLNTRAQTTAKPVKTQDTTARWENLTFTVDSATWKAWYYIINAGIGNLMKTNIPANEVEAVQSFGINLSRQLIEMYNKRYTPAKPAVK